MAWYEQNSEGVKEGEEEEQAGVLLLDGSSADSMQHLQISQRH